jgi:hypothetical protein
MAMDPAHTICRCRWAVGEHGAACYAALTGAADGGMLAGSSFHLMKSVLKDWQGDVFT